MANAEMFRGANTQFFPLQGPRVQRGDDVVIPTDAANADYPGISKGLTQSEEDAVWAQYEAMPPSADAMEKASNVGSSRRWIIPGVLAAAFAVGIGYAALTDKPMQISEPTLAATEAPVTDSSSTALMGGVPVATGPTLTPQSAFDASQPTTISPPPSTPAPAANEGTNAVERSTVPPAKTARTPPAAAQEPAPPAPTYSRGEAPSTTLPSSSAHP